MLTKQGRVGGEFRIQPSILACFSLMIFLIFTESNFFSFSYFVVIFGRSNGFT